MERIIKLIESKAWAILPSYLQTIHQIIWNKINNLNNLSDIEKVLDKKLQNEFQLTAESVSFNNSVEKNILIIPVYGVIAKRMNLLTEISGGTSTEILKTTIDEALNNTEIDAIILDIDSPGGTVDGTKEIADFIYESRGKKPIVAYANGLMASAAYWIGSAADKIVGYDTAHIGSIGVIMEHYDYSKADEMEGLKRTFIYAGKYKAMGNDAEPLSEEAKDYFQGMVDYIYTIFVDSVARNRNVSSKFVLENMADGKIFIGEDARRVMLIDEIMNMEKAIQLAALMAIEKDMEAQKDIASQHLTSLSSKADALLKSYKGK